ncbi:hypothetical protein G3489_24070, partial [Shewanella baltica]|uniref:hypothetical protein n=1 Tax=Shewanella baltica TaxID=62322 RepID=UPI00217CC768
LDATAATIDTANIKTAKVDRIEAQQIALGANSISYSGTRLNLNAGKIATNGVLSLGGDIEGNNKNITGINSFSANNGTFTTFNATTGTVAQLSGKTLDYDSGSIDTLTGNNLNYGTGVIGSLSGNSLNYSTGTIGNLTGNTLTYTNVNGGTGTFTNLNGQNASFNSATIGGLSVTGTSNLNQVNAKRIDATNGYFDLVSANTVAGTKGQFTNLNATGTTTLNTVTANSGTI